MATTGGELCFRLDQPLYKLGIREDIQSLDETFEVIRRQQHGLSLPLTGNDQTIGRLVDLLDEFEELLLELGDRDRLDRHGRFLLVNYTRDRRRANLDSTAGLLCFLRRFIYHHLCALDLF
jgi:hypothetical protein